MVFTINPPILPDDSRLESAQDADGTLEQLDVARNSLSRAASLPGDVIVAILFELAFIRHGRWSPMSTDEWHSPCQWISATHVCKSWRDTALNNPLLWSHVTWYGIPERVETFLRRSTNQCPLTIAASVNASKWGPRYRRKEPPRNGRYGSSLAMNAKFIAEFGHRIRELYRVTIETPDDGVLLASRQRRATFPVLDAINDSSDVISRLVSLCHMPRLTRLNVSFMMETSLSSFASARLTPTLTSLHIRLLDYTSTLPQWLDTLSGLPLLEELAIKGHLQFSASATVVESASYTPVSFPHLRQLEFAPSSTELLEAFATLLAHISCPANSQLKFDVPTGRRSASSDIIGFILPHLAFWYRERHCDGGRSNLPQREPLHFFRVEVVPLYDPLLQFAGATKMARRGDITTELLELHWYNEDPGFLGKHLLVCGHTKPIISLTLPFPSSYKAQQALRHFPDLPLLSDLTHLSIFNLTADSSLWKHIATRCPRVTHLRASSESASLGQLHRSICVLERATARDQDRTILLYPQLQVLQFWLPSLSDQPLPLPDAFKPARPKGFRTLRQKLSNVIWLRRASRNGPTALYINGKELDISFER